MNASDRPPLIVQLLRRWQPRAGWAIFGLAVVVAFCLVGAVLEQPPVPGLGPLIWLSPLGVGSAWWLAGRYRARRPWEVLGPLAAMATGMTAILVWGVFAFNPWPPLVQAGRWLSWALRCGAWPKCQSPAPTLSAFAEQWAQLTGFSQRVGWWLEGAVSGQGVADNLVLAAVGMLIGWLAAAWLGWWIGRYGRPFPAVLPTGFLLVEQVYWADAGYGWLLIFIGALAPLLALVRFHRLTTTWEAEGTDYSPEVRLDITFASVILAGMAVTLAPFLPFLTSAQVSEAFWRIFRQPYQAIEDRLEASFPGVQPGRSLVPPTGVAATGLPRSHLLGGRPELGQEIALRVWPRGAGPGETLYWRGQTFSRYTGRGWSEPDPLPGRPQLREDFGAGEPWDPAPPLPGRVAVLSSIEVAAATRAVLYAAGEPVAADRPYIARQRAPGELIALSARDAPARYAVLGQVARPDPDVLRNAGTGYPAAIADLYLALPADLPPELAAYAAGVTAAAANPYDRAVALESALRQLPYSLEVPAPPADREVASWFLFELQQGYCDYFATAMAVLARQVGIPSRLAIGYATGTYDERTGSYVVTELQAHSWPELYFPRYGWIPFEPTPAQPLPLRWPSGDAASAALAVNPHDAEARLAELRQIAAAEVTISARRLWLGRLLRAICLLLIAWRVYGWRRLHVPPRPPGVAGLYSALAAWGIRLGRPPRPADTPAEYAATLGQVAQEVARRARLGRTAAQAAAARVSADAPGLAQMFTAAVYGPQPAESESRPSQPRPATAADRPWQPLWAALRRLWLARWGI